MTFTERADLVAYHPDARVFEVRDADGTAVGLYVSTSTPATRSAAAPG